MAEITLTPWQFVATMIPTTTSAGIGGGSNVDVKLVDIEWVEVLRGPQGTAFGSSGLGGVVRTIPVEPKLDRVEGKVGVGYSVTSGTGGDNNNVEAVGNLPLVKDKLAIRASAFRYEQSGFARNVAGSNPNAVVQGAITDFGAQDFAVDEEEAGTARYTGGRIAALFQATDKLKLTLNYLTQKAEKDGFPGASPGAFDYSLLQVAPEHARDGWPGAWADTDIDITNAVVEYDFGWANLLGSYSYIESGSGNASSWTVFGIPLPISGRGVSDQNSHVAEIRLATHLDGPWNFLAGLYAEDIDDDLALNYFWHGDPAPADFGGKHSQRKLTQKAAFGEALWEFLPGLTFTAGIRAFDYERTGHDESSGPILGVVDAELVPNKETGESGRANLSYKINDSALVYGGWSQGFRFGAVQVGIPPGICDQNGDGVIDGTSIPLNSASNLKSDTVDNYEIGTKMMLLDHRLLIDAAVYRMDWSDIPGAAMLTPEDDGVSELCGLVSSHSANVGAARSEGVEFQANFQVSDVFRFDIGGSWIDAKTLNDSSFGTPAGTRLAGVPKYNANLGLQYEFGIAGLRPSVRADAIYVGEYDTYQPGTLAGDYVKVDLSARVPIGSADIDIYVRNLTNEYAYVSSGFANLWNVPLRPRTVGLDVKYRFGD